MSLTTEITNLTSQVTQLTQRVDGWVSDADARITAAVRAIPNTSRVVYVDAANGDDSATGTADEPLATLHAALQSGVPGGVLRIRLLSDVSHGMWTWTPHGSVVRIEGWDAAAVAPQRRAVHFSSAAANDGGKHASIELGLGSVLRLLELDIDLAAPPSGAADPDTACIRSWIGQSIYIDSCAITGDAAASVLWTYSATTMVVRNGSSISGPRWLSHLAAGAAIDPADWRIITNITTN